MADIVPEYNQSNILTEETLDMKMIRICQAIKEYGDHLGRRTVARI